VDGLVLRKQGQLERDLTVPGTPVTPHTAAPEKRGQDGGQCPGGRCPGRR
jgi:hypothetical protein